MEKVRAKKHLGQHFLNDLSIAEKIAASLPESDICNQVLEVGPGMGVLTEFLLKNERVTTHVIELDRESVAYLKNKYPQALANRIVEGDFLRFNLPAYFSGQFFVIGNFPYNISSQIFFKVVENRFQIPAAVGMVQKEVAERMAAKHGNKTYGILSVLLQTFYSIEYLFTVHEHVFTPPPKVKSAVIRLMRNERTALPCDEKMFYRIVKQSFSMRRKTLRNCLKALNISSEMLSDSYFDKRAEQLSVQEFIDLTVRIEEHLKNKTN